MRFKACMQNCSHRLTHAHGKHYQSWQVLLYSYSPQQHTHDFGMQHMTGTAGVNCLCKPSPASWYVQPSTQSWQGNQTCTDRLLAP